MTGCLTCYGGFGCLSSRFMAFGFFVLEIWIMGQWEGGVNHIQKTFYACFGTELKTMLEEEEKITIQSKKVTN